MEIGEWAFQELYGLLRWIWNIFPGKTSVEPDFSVVKYKKNFFRTSILRITLEGEIYRKQYETLQVIALCNWIYVVRVHKFNQSKILLSSKWSIFSKFVKSRIYLGLLVSHMSAFLDAVEYTKLKDILNLLPKKIQEKFLVHFFLTPKTAQFFLFLHIFFLILFKNSRNVYLLRKVRLLTICKPFI